MTVKITTTTKTASGGEFSRILDNLKKRFQGPTKIMVGVPKNAGDYKDGPSFAVVGAVNEFGSADGRIPARPHLIPGVVDHQDEYNMLLAEGLKEVAQGNLTNRQVLEQLGELARANVQQKIVEVRSPPNAASTVDRKGSSNPLIDTGAYRQSINYVILEEGEQVDEGL